MTGPRQHAYLIAVILAASAIVGPVEPARAGPPADARIADAVVLSAERAKQADSQDAYSLSGDLVMHSKDWQISADRARLLGHLSDPSRIELEGQPASITVFRDDGREPFRGLGKAVVFEPRRDVVNLEGGASVVSGGQSITSESIRYWLERETFAAGAGGRVRVVTEADTVSPARRGKAGR